jgi:hypothetical protein
LGLEEQVAGESGDEELREEAAKKFARSFSMS